MCLGLLNRSGRVARHGATRSSSLLLHFGAIPAGKAVTKWYRFGEARFEQTLWHHNLSEATRRIFSGILEGAI